MLSVESACALCSFSIFLSNDIQLLSQSRVYRIRQTWTDFFLRNLANENCNFIANIWFVITLRMFPYKLQTLSMSWMLLLDPYRQCKVMMISIKMIRVTHVTWRVANQQLFSKAQYFCWLPSRSLTRENTKSTPRQIAIFVKLVYSTTSCTPY